MSYSVIFQKKNTAQLKLDLSQKIRDKTKESDVCFMQKWNK